MKQLLILFLLLSIIILTSCSSSKQDETKVIGTLPQSSTEISTESTDFLIEQSTSTLIEQSSEPTAEQSTYNETTQPSRMTDEYVESLRIAFHTYAEYAKYLNEEERNRTVLLMMPGLDILPEDEQLEIVNKWLDIFNSMNNEIDKAQEEFENIISDGLYQNEIERVRELSDIIEKNTYVTVTEQKNDDNQ